MDCGSNRSNLTSKEVIQKIKLLRLKRVTATLLEMLEIVPDGKGSFWVSILLHEGYLRSLTDSEAATSRLSSSYAVVIDKVSVETKVQTQVYVEGTDNQPLDPQSLVDAVCAYFKLHKFDLTPQRSNDTAIYPRFLLLYLLCKRTQLSRWEIGKLIQYQGVVKIFAPITIVHLQWWADQRDGNLTLDITSVINLAMENKTDT